MRILGNLAIAWFAAFFLCGALLFPLLNPYYMSRVVLSAGLMSLVYGIESILRAGRIEACGLLSGNCTEHSFRAVGFILWAACFAALMLRQRLKAAK